MKSFKTYLTENISPEQEQPETGEDIREEVEQILEKISMIALELKNAPNLAITEDWMLLAIETAELEVTTLHEYLRYRNDPDDNDLDTE